MRRCDGVRGSGGAASARARSVFWGAAGGKKSGGRRGAGDIASALDAAFAVSILSNRADPKGGKFTAFLFQIARNYGLNQREKFRFRHQFDAAQTADDLQIMAPPLTQPERVVLEQSGNGAARAGGLRNCRRFTAMSSRFATTTI